MIVTMALPRVALPVYLQPSDPSPAVLEQSDQVLNSWSSAADRNKLQEISLVGFWFGFPPHQGTRAAPHLPHPAPAPPRHRNGANTHGKGLTQG